MKQVIVTRVIDFIGRALVDVLIQNRYEVYAIVRNSNKIEE